MGKPSFSIRAEALIPEGIRLATGGYHLFSTNEWEIIKIIEAFRESGVEKVCPCHCTGDLARRLFQESYGKGYIKGGVERVIGMLRDRARDGFNGKGDGGLREQKAARTQGECPAGIY